MVYARLLFFRVGQNRVYTVLANPTLFLSCTISYVTYRLTRILFNFSPAEAVKEESRSCSFYNPGQDITYSITQHR